MSGRTTSAAGRPTGADAESGPDAPDTAANYEHARDELAQVVNKLESGGLSLEESLTLWERGEQLAKQCTAFLDGARERVDAALAEAEEPADS
jgi:exodeoxyribonuclease VII small subunit